MGVHWALRLIISTSRTAEKFIAILRNSLPYWEIHCHTEKFMWYYVSHPWRGRPQPSWPNGLVIIIIINSSSSSSIHHHHYASFYLHIPWSWKIKIKIKIEISKLHVIIWIKLQVVHRSAFLVFRHSDVRWAVVFESHLNRIPINSNYIPIAFQSYIEEGRV
jgi:hypothetical protein